MSTDTRTPEEIERDIETERAQLAASLDALQERFSVQGITRQIADQVSEHGGEFGHSALRSAKSNPVALALTGIGLAWMMVSDARRSNGAAGASASAHGHGASPQGFGTSSTHAKAASGASHRWDRMTSDAGRYGHRARASAEDLRNRLHEGTEHLSEAARKRVVAARESAYRAQAEMERAAGRGGKEIMDFYSEQPLVAGALALAIGAAIGAALPRTDTEDRSMGDSSDRLFEEAERIFREEMDSAEKAVKSAASKPESTSGGSASQGTGTSRPRKPASSASGRTGTSGAASGKEGG